jgi:hypothetical protein
MCRCGRHIRRYCSKICIISLYFLSIFLNKEDYLRCNKIRRERFPVYFKIWVTIGPVKSSIWLYMPTNFKPLAVVL